MADPKFLTQVQQQQVDERRRISAPGTIVVYSCALVLTFSVLVLLGWFLDIDSLRTMTADGVSMKANTAICFALLALATLSFRKQTDRAWVLGFGFTLTALAFLIATVSLSEYIFEMNLGIDEFFFIDPAISSSVVSHYPAGRPAPIELLNFIFLSVSLYLMNWPALRSHRTSQFLVFIVFVSSMQGLMSFAVGMSSIFGSADYTQMAAHTTASFIILCLGLLAARPDRGFIEAFGSDSPSSIMARRMLVAIIFAPLVVRWLANTGYQLEFYDQDFSALIQLIGGMVVMGAILIWSATLLYQSEKAREEARMKADAANRAKTNFLANISHEIRTPLGAVLGFSELLASEDNDGKQKEDLTAAIRRNGDQLLRLIDDLLDISKIEAGHLTLEKTDFPLLDFLEDVGSIARLRCEERGIQFEIGYKSALPEMITTDRSRLRQILLNVIGNAIKFNEKGGRVTVLLDFLSATPPLLRFAVRDTGPGISREAAAQLFQPFTQVDSSASRKFGGSGLGLALSRRIAVALGGDLRLHESVVGRGSLFYVEIDPGPRAKIRLLNLGAAAVTREQVKEVRTPTASKEKPPELRDVKILVVEDSADNRALISRFLKTSGAEVELACDGLEGVQKALHGTFDIVLMDLQMPNLDGYDAIKRLRGIGYKVPIVALTAHAFKEDRDRCLKIGFNEHLTKPVNKSELLHTVEAFVH